MLATYMLLWKKDGGENNLQPFSPTTSIIVTDSDIIIENVNDIAFIIIIDSSCISVSDNHHHQDLFL